MKPMTGYAFTFLPVLLLAVACTPKVQIEAPDKPITINLNVKIEQEVRIRLEKEVDDLLTSRPDLF
jgi:hypothetical protein